MILSATEREILAQVPTSYEDADQILRRNEALLRALDTDPGASEARTRYVGRIGCPHCQKAQGGYPIPCHVCAWSEAQILGGLRLWRCLDATFGGVRLGEVGSIIMFGIDHETVSYYPSSPALLGRARRFLLGHIEWVEGILGARKPDEEKQG